MRSRAILATTLAALAAVATVQDAAVGVDGSVHRLRLPVASRPLPVGTQGRAAVTPPADLARAVRSVATGRGARTAPSSAPRLTTSAVPASAPTIISPGRGATVHGDVTLTVTSTAPVVRVSAFGVTKDVTVVDGTGTATLPSWGYAGVQTITAADCDGAGACGTPVQLDVTVTNASPALTLPAEGATVATSFSASATSGGVAVAFTLDGRHAAVDTAAPFDQVLYTDGLSAGPHTVAVVQCNSAGTVCDDAHPSSGVQVTVRQHLSPTISRISPSPFSPNGDGRRDTATVTYRLDTKQAVSWRVTDAGGSTVVPSRSLGQQVAGSHAFVLKGIRADGSYLPSGRYTVHLDTSEAVTDSTIEGHAMAAVTIDRTPPGTSSLSATPRTLYPVRDGYRDSTVIRARLSERVTSATLQILNGSGRAVRSLSLGARPAGRVSVRWNGRRANGSMVPAGRYRYRFVLQDPAGNRAVSRSNALSVSAKKLVTRSGSRTVTAYGSAIGVVKGACSEVTSPGVRGWKRSVGYYSDVYDDGTSDCWYADGHDLAATVHAMTLPRAVRYRSMRVDAYGGKALKKYNDVAVLLYYTGKGQLTSTGRKLGSAVATHTGRTVGSKFISPKGKVRWVAATIGGNFYDIKSFTVHYTYSVLG